MRTLKTQVMAIGRSKYTTRESQDQFVQAIYDIPSQSEEQLSSFQSALKLSV